MHSKREISGGKPEEKKEQAKSSVNVEMGWMDILSNLKRLSNSNTVDVQIRNLEKAWKPLISDLEKLIKQVQTKHMELLMFEAPAQAGAQGPIQNFLTITNQMITKAKTLMESIDFDLYFVPDEKAAKAVKADNAVIVYENPKNNYCARILAKKSYSIKEDVDTIVTRVPAELIKKCETLPRNAKNEIILTEGNVELIDKTAKEIVEKANIKIPKKKIKKLLSGALNLADDVPAFLDAFAKLPIVPMVKEKLDKLKTGGEGFDLGNVLKAVLPIEMYKQLRNQAFDALKPEEFKLLSRDKQAAALALMESYNTAIKFAVLAMDRVEIENGLVAGAITTKIGIIDNKSIKELCEEFNEVYAVAMKTAGFTVPAELYPYNFSVLEQRQAMLAALPAENKENVSESAIQRRRLQERIAVLGDVKPLPKRENPEDFYQFMEKILNKHYKKLKELKRQLVSEAQVLEDDVKDDSKPVDITKEAKLIILKVEEQIKKAVGESVFRAYFVNEGVADKEPPWVQEAANAFHNVKKIIAKIEQLQKQHLDLSASRTPLAYLEYKITEVDELTESGTKLLTALSQIKKIVKDKLDKFKKRGEKLDLSGMAKEILPIDMYQNIKKELFQFYSEEKFKKLSRDEQAAALALMEVYNEAIKFAVLWMDKLEVENDLPPGSLSTNIIVVDDKTISQLCIEFNGLYKEALVTAKYHIPSELYPFEASLLQQRNAMLKEFPENVSNLKKDRIKKRISELKNVQELPPRENSKEFFSMVKMKLEENYKRVKELKDRLMPPEEKKREKDEELEKLSNKIESAKKFIEKAENELKQSLDDQVYQRYFINEHVIDKNAHWVQFVGKAFINLKEKILEIEMLQEQHNKIKETLTPFAHLTYRVRELDALVKAGTELAAILVQMGEDPHLKQLISTKTFESMLRSILAPLEEQKVITEEAKETIKSITQSSAPLSAIVRSIKNILERKLNSNDRYLKESAATVLTQAIQLIQALEFNQNNIVNAGEKISLFTFSVNHFSEISSVLGSLPEIFSVLVKISESESLKIAEKINVVLKNMVLECDKLEIQFCLKEGFLTDRLRPILNEYHTEIKKLGYDFKPEDRYPYKDAIMSQRGSLLLLPKISPLQTNLIQERMKAMEVKNQDNLKEKKQTNEEHRERIIKDEIEKHISDLKFLQRRAKFMKNNAEFENIAIKIKLLEALKNDKDSPFVIGKDLDRLRSRWPDEIHLLYEGNTANVLKKLEFLSEGDIQDVLNIKLTALKKQRSRAQYIYSKQSADFLEKRINACERLQELLKTNNVAAAIRKLDFLQSELLEKHDSELLEKIKLIEKSIPYELRTRTIIERKTEAKNDLALAVETKERVEKKEYSPEQQHALDLVNHRIKELDSAIFHTKTNRLKAEILTELKAALKPGVSLDNAIKQIKAGKQAEHVYLIFEGRTGKAIKSAQHGTMTLSDLIRRLDVEINALKKQRYTHLYVFAKSGKANLERDIQSLQNLKYELAKGGGKAIMEVYDSLDSKNKALLQRYESDLLEDLKAIPKHVKSHAVRK